MTRTIYVMRHAKSSWSTDDADHQRPLNGRGRREAPVAGAYLATRGPIDQVLSSTSARTRETWAAAEEGGAEAVEVNFYQQMYNARAEDHLELLRELPSETQSALILAHFPGVLELVRSLATRDDHPAWPSLDKNFPTSAIAVLEFDGEWESLSPGDAKLIDYVIPRDS